jgi:hypothetical protein
MPDLWTLYSTKAEVIGAAPTDQRRVTNRGPGTFYYKATSDVGSGDTAVTSGSAVTFDSANWIVSASTSNVTVEHFAGDVSITDDLTVADDLTVTGATTLGSEGLDTISAFKGVANWQPVAATSGTNTTPADGTQFVTSIFLPANKTITNVNYLIGDTGGTDKVYAVLYSNSGAVLGNSSLTTGGATVGTAANIQTLALTSTYAAKGPANFFVGISMNGNTARLRTVPAFTQAGILAGSVSQTHGTVAAITPPTTFTADKAPVVFLN